MSHIKLLLVDKLPNGDKLWVDENGHKHITSTDNVHPLIKMHKHDE